MKPARYKHPGIGDEQPVPAPVAVMLEEYFQLYALALYRLTALDERVPMVGAILTAILGTVVVMPPVLQVAALLGAPLTIAWLFRTTVNHARSLEDALRGIERIEHRVNEQLGVRALSFQSSHPSRGRYVGGRTGNETVRAVLGAAGVLLATAMFLMGKVVGVSDILLVCYSAFAVLVGIDLVASYVRLQLYGA